MFHEYLCLHWCIIHGGACDASDQYICNFLGGNLLEIDSDVLFNKETNIIFADAEKEMFPRGSSIFVNAFKDPYKT